MPCGITPLTSQKDTRFASTQPVKALHTNPHKHTCTNTLFHPRREKGKKERDGEEERGEKGTGCLYPSMKTTQEDTLMG